MPHWNQLSNVWIEVPVRSAGNVVINRPMEFAVYQSDAVYKAVPLCEATDKTLAMLKEEVQFYFRQDKAVSVEGILDGNQHIVERLGEVLKTQGTTQE